MRVLVTIALMFPAMAWAQQNGNVYDGTAHQPTAAVQQQEQAAGVAAPAPQQQADTQFLEENAKKQIANAPKGPTATCIKELARC